MDDGDDEGSEPHWLSEHESVAWIALIRAIRTLLTGLDRQLQRDADMTHADYGILVALSEAPKRTLQMSSLAAEVAFSPSRLSHAFSRIEQRKWVQRWHRPEDRRQTLATLTPAGLDAIERAAPGHVRYVIDTVFDGATDTELRTLTRFMTRIIANSSATN